MCNEFVTTHKTRENTAEKLSNAEALPNIFFKVVCSEAKKKEIVIFVDGTIP